MKSFKALETAAIFFLANLFLKQCISSEYVMVELICMGLFGTQTENNKMKNSCPQLDSNPGPSAYEANALCVEILKLLNIDHLKVTAFALSLLCKFPVPRVHLVLPVFFIDVLSCIFLI